MILARMKLWWAAVPIEPAPAVAFEVACPCGQAARGVRRPRHQAVRCLACGAPVFVLGTSPLPPPGGLPVAARARGPAPWRGPLLAAGLTFAAVVAAFAVLLPFLIRPDVESPSTPEAQIRQSIETGRRALAEEKFLLAVRELGRARALVARSPDTLTPAEIRGLAQLHRQAALLADLLRESLGEVLQVAAGLREDEWQAQFEQRYLNQAVLFDDTIGRDAAGGFRLAVYEVRAPGEPARVDLDNLNLLKALPWEGRPRLLFGARLAAVTREPPGRWVVRFEPDSGVLLTDEGAAGACCPQPLDAELKDVLKRQAEWAAALP